MQQSWYADVALHKVLFSVIKKQQFMSSPVAAKILNALCPRNRISLPLLNFEHLKYEYIFILFFQWLSLSLVSLLVNCSLVFFQQFMSLVKRFVYKFIAKALVLPFFFSLYIPRHSNNPGLNTNICGIMWETTLDWLTGILLARSHHQDRPYNVNFSVVLKNSMHTPKQVIK